MTQPRVRVLVVDDEEPILHATKALLEELDFEATTHSDPFTIHEELRRCRADVLLQDVRMPGLNVAHLLETIRADHATQGTRVVLFSAGLELQGLGRELGVRVVEKPFTPAHLSAALRDP